MGWFSVKRPHVTKTEFLDQIAGQLAASGTSIIGIPEFGGVELDYCRQLAEISKTYNWIKYRGIYFYVYWRPIEFIGVIGSPSKINEKEERIMFWDRDWET